MANLANLLATIAANVYTNHNNEVTAQMVKDALGAIVSTMGQGGYIYKGLATTSTNPSSPDANVFYIATAAGTYTNFGGIVVNAGEVAILKGTGTSWSKDVTGAATAAKLTELEQKVSYTPTFAWTEDKAVNSAIKELYLTGLKPDKYYYFRYLCKGDGGDELVYIRECDDLSGTNPVLVVRSVEETPTNGILRLEAYNGSGISGYIIKNITSPTTWNPIEAYINKSVASNIDYSPRIKEYLDNAVLSAGLSEVTAIVNDAIIRNINELQGLTPVNGRYYTHSGGIWNNVATASAYEEKIPIRSGETFYFRNLYAYFCGEMTSGGTWIPFANATNIYDGSFTAAADGELRITINDPVVGNGVPLLTKSKEMYDNLFFDSYNKFNGDTGAQRVFRVGSTRDYTTLRAGVAEAIKFPRSIVYVDAEEYDLLTEFAAEIAAEGTVQYGILIGNGVHIIFENGAKVKALYDGSVENVKKYFAPFFTDATVNYGFTLENLDIEVSNTRYCVHDELNGADIFSINKYINCKMSMDDSAEYHLVAYYPQCIGGGTGLHTYVEIRNCYFKSKRAEGTEIPLVSYHNCSTGQSQSKIIVTDSYFADKGTYRCTHHGVSTLMSQSFLNNNSFGSAPQLAHEGGGAGPENFEILGFLNEVRS